MKLVKLVSISIALLIIQACSHPIEIEGQGDVKTLSGNRTCMWENFTNGDAACTKNYVVYAYEETYYPEARPGWKFDHWVTYCTDAAPPNYYCPFDIPKETVRDYWGKTIPPLKAVFTSLLPKPITDTVTADGMTWAQVDLFLGLSPLEINAACPAYPAPAAGVCTGTLRGFDMRGWTWASLEDLALMVSRHGVSLPDEPARYLDFDGSGVSQGDSPWAPRILDEVGWRPLPSLFERRIEGYTRTNTRSYDSDLLCGTSNVAFGSISLVDAVIPAGGEDFIFLRLYCAQQSDAGRGAWFYQSAPIPITDTITADGKTWAQVDLFLGSRGDQIAAVCPGVSGVCTGTLNGHDMTGWTWASRDELSIMFNSYGISPPPQAANHYYVSAINSFWAPGFFGVGWRSYLGAASRRIEGYTRSGGDYGCRFLWATTVYDDVMPSRSDFVDSNRAYCDYGFDNARGAWFYHD